ncbi:hypothetical protein [Virgibacillus ihumii]|uniref:hypothetical protein n=1 Tax=Virgibacillus ihumii TaxID=2686091 RepID=UPI00157CAF8C|nr:hypothetical protein [Virgibacillus ihumii]
MDNSKHDFEQNVLINQLLKDYLEENMKDLMDTSNEKNNSFLFLDGNTLHMIIAHILMNSNTNFYNKGNEAPENSELEDFLPELDSIMEQNKAAFEDIINTLKEKR